MRVINLLKGNIYGLYVVLLFFLAYLLNQLGRYGLPVATQSMARELHYGEKSCVINEEEKDFQFQKNNTWTESCAKRGSASLCSEFEWENETEICKWEYNGQGVDYQLLIGPIFIFIFTFTGIFVGFAADLYNRRNLLALSILFWNGMTVLTSVVQSYWQLALVRFGFGIGVAGCNPFAVSILTDIIPPNLRAAAFGMYNWGIYTGFSLSFAIGNSVVPTLGWRWFFVICGMPGLVIAALVLFTVKEPPRCQTVHKNPMIAETKDFRCLLREGNSVLRCLAILTKPLLNPAILMLFLAGSIRNVGGYVWGYNTQPFFLSVSTKSPQDARSEITHFLSWIPMVAGSVSVFAGGLLTDRIVKRFGVVARVWVVCASQILAAPFAAGALYLPAPWCYLTLIPAYIIGELWVSVCQAVLVELIPAAIRTSAVAIYFFVITNVGGNATFLVPYVKQAFLSAGYSNVESFRYALYIFYPGMFFLSGIFFALATMFVQKQLTALSKPYEWAPGDERVESQDEKLHLEERKKLPIDRDD